MTIRFLATLASCAVLCAPVLAGPAYSDTQKAKYQKLQTGETTLRKKSGYWVECSYSGLGDNCYTVYAHVRTPAGGAPGAAAKLMPLKADSNVTLRRKAGYWVECTYSGLGENCYYVYASPHKPAKPKP